MFSPDNPFTGDRPPGSDQQSTDAPASDSTPFGDDFAALFGAGDTAVLEAYGDLIAAVLKRQGDTADTTDDLLTVTALSKKIADTVKGAYDDARVRLWHLTGPGTHATEDGRSFSFSTPSGRRSTDLKRLEAEYPDVYADVVKTSPPKPDAVGTLTLKKGAKK